MPGFLLRAWFSPFTFHVLLIPADPASGILVNHIAFNEPEYVAVLEAANASHPDRSDYSPHTGTGITLGKDVSGASLQCSNVLCRAWPQLLPEVGEAGFYILGIK